MKTSFRLSSKGCQTARSIRPLIFGIVILGITFTVGAIQPPFYSDEDGQEVFNRVCATCHTVTPPAEMMKDVKAPPMQMIRRHYFDQLESENDVRLALNVWLLQPDSVRSLMPTHAITKHGLMPRLQLSDEERVAVVDYILQMEGPVKGKMMGGECNHMQNGKAGMKSGGMKQGLKQGMKHQSDSTASGGQECSMMKEKAKN